MHNSKSPPVNLDKYLEGKEHHYISYEAGARKNGMAYWSFVRICQEIGANIPLRNFARTKDTFCRCKRFGNNFPTSAFDFVPQRH